jgi:DNA invertase Pin-like site-specific DNA recombinase
MSDLRTAAIYARISDDREGSGAGVQRQLDDCRELAAKRGWTVGAEYVDNDISAYSGKRRPQYERMLRAIERGEHHAVLAYHLDRLHRRPIELETFADVCDRAGAQVATVQQDLNLGTSDGLLSARVLGAVANYASQRAGERIRRKMLELARQGRRHGSGHRQFGYDRDGYTVRDDEAQLLRDLTARLLAGESLNSLTNWLNERQTPTASGHPLWLRTTLRGILENPGICGLRTHNGEIIGPAAWPAIITPEQGEKVRTLLQNRARGRRRPARRYLLAGMLRCHNCGETMRAWPKGETRNYVCGKNADRPNACGGTYIKAEPVEQLIAEAVLMRLDTPALADAASGKRRREDDSLAQLREAISADAQQLTDLAEAHGNKLITLPEWLTARKPIEARLAKARRELADTTGTPDLAELAGTGTALRDSWPTLNLDRQRAIIAAVLDHAVIGPGKPGRSSFDPGRVRPTWRV